MENLDSMILFQKLYKEINKGIFVKENKEVVLEYLICNFYIPKLVWEIWYVYFCACVTIEGWNKKGNADIYL